MSFDFDQIVENHFKEKRDIYGFESIAQLIEEVLEQRHDLIEVLTEAEDRPSIDMGVWDGIVDIPISEIPWATVSTEEGGADVPSRQRAQLEQFLGRIEGNDLAQKIQKLTDFYNADAASLEGLPEFGGPKGTRVANAIAYLTFYKTLTKIIAHFNASSAGFSFEAFLGVLLGGTQIAASGAKTIADLTTADGTPVSLKLYNEATLKVGGSYHQLVNDLIGDKQMMQYVVATKTLEGEGEELKGHLDFYRFNFTLQNVATVLSSVGRQNPLLIQLPEAFIANPEGFNVELPEPPTLEELVELFNASFEEAAGEYLDADVAAALSKEINFPNNVDILGTSKGRTPGADRISLNGAAFAALLEKVGIVRENFPTKAAYERAKRNAKLATKAADLRVEEAYKRARTVRADLIRQSETGAKGTEQEGSGFADAATSVKFYNETLSGRPELQKRALLISRGYVYTDQFEMDRGEVTEKLNTMGIPDLFPADQEQVTIGRLEIGYEPIAKMVGELKNIMDASIFAIFRDLKVLTTNLQAFFANGLQETQDQPYASEAQAAAASIDKGVEETAQEFSTEEN